MSAPETIPLLGCVQHNCQQCKDGAAELAALRLDAERWRAVRSYDELGHGISFVNEEITTVWGVTADNLADAAIAKAKEPK